MTCYFCISFSCCSTHIQVQFLYSEILLNTPYFGGVAPPLFVCLGSLVYTGVNIGFLCTSVISFMIHCGVNVVVQSDSIC